MTASAQSTARSAASILENSTILRVLARGGYAVNGLLHIVIGVIALGVAFGNSAEADQGGALQQLATNPIGLAALWLIVVGLFALGLFQLVIAALVRGSGRDEWADRAKEGGKGIAYIAVGFSALTFALGGSSDSSSQTTGLSAKLLSTPGGVVLLVVLALAVIAIGVYFIVKGAKKKFLSDISQPGGTVGRGVTALGVAGYCAKGVAVAIVGVLFAVAAFTSDPDKATGLDGALKSLAALPFGVVILTVVALGFLAYGVYSFFRARYARL